MADLVRDAFETWGKSKYLYLERANEHQTEQGRSYYTEQSENMWLAFQAGAALATPPATPVQPTASVEGVAQLILELGIAHDRIAALEGVDNDDLISILTAARVLTLSLTPAPTRAEDRNPAYDGPMGIFEGYGEEP